MWKYVYLSLFILPSWMNVQGQNQEKPVEQYAQHLQKYASDWNLTANDLMEFRVRDKYTSRHTGAKHIYLNQQYNGLDVYNAIVTLTLRPDGEPLSAFSRFVPELEDKIVGERPTMAAIDAVVAAFSEVGIEAEASDFVLSELREDKVIFRAERLSRSDIPVELVYQPLQDGRVELAYDLSFDPESQLDYWSIRTSAIDGRVLDKVSWTVSCKLDDIPSHRHTQSCFSKRAEQGYSARGADGVVADNLHFGAKRLGQVNEESAYRVVPFPYESPIHGDFELVESPYDEEFSPLGWHSISPGDQPDFTTTRGNNVIAFVDRQGSGSPDISVDGGSNLVFDFPFDQDWEPEEYMEAAVTNLFYWNNILHDFSMAYGFDEAAGNFQVTNLTGQGQGNDPVRAISQSGANTGFNFNNATFSSPPDGNPGTMNMFVWTRNSADASLLTVEEPVDVAGSYETGTATFGASITEDPIIADVVIVNDGVGIVTDACEDIINSSEIAGNIALIDRGQCEFGAKVLNAEQSGAIAVIICNNRSGGIVNMAPGAVGDLVTIPSVFISQSDCNIIRAHAENGLKVRLQRPEIGGPDMYDASFDNGIIAHEFAHGISLRMTGGPSSSGCLSNSQNGNRSDGQQMGEAWSDFFTLITGMRPGDTKNTNRGVGNYVIRASTDARGIRSYPYNYNMDANPVTYYDTYDASVPHGVGHVFASMLWDLLWAMIDEYGFDPDWYRGTGGNNMAVQLVMDGLKIQPCNPGFVDGRDAILAADELLYDGANQCLIWSVFARRGLGFGAEQGNPMRVRDARESYDLPPTCLPTVKIHKEMTPNIEAGDNIDVQLTLVSHKSENPTGVEIRDQIPEGASVIHESLPAGASVDGNEIVIPVGELDFDQEVIFEYQLATDIALFSKIILEEDNEDQVSNRFIPGALVGNDFFELTTNDAFSGSQSWFAPNTNRSNDQSLTYTIPIEVEGEFPVLRVAHRYNTEDGTDGGLITVSNDGLVSQIDLGYAMFREDYPNRISGATFSQGDLKAFSGNSQDWVQTYADLSDFRGETLFLQFRFGSDDNVSMEGWYIDDFEVFEAHNYNSEVVVISDNGIETTAYAGGRGTIVEPQLPVSTEEPVVEQPSISLFPNPARDFLNVVLREMPAERDASLVITDVKGRQVDNRSISIEGSHQSEKIDVSGFPSGTYNISLVTNGSVWTERFIVVK